MQESHTIFKYGIFITLIRLVCIPGSIWDFINLSRHTPRNCFTWDAVTLFSSNRTKMNRNNDKTQQSSVCVIMRLHVSGISWIQMYFYKHYTELTWWQFIRQNVYYSKLLPCRINFWAYTINEVSKKYQYPSHFKCMNGGSWDTCDIYWIQYEHLSLKERLTLSLFWNPHYSSGTRFPAEWCSLVFWGHLQEGKTPLWNCFWCLPFKINVIVKICSFCKKCNQ